MHTVAMGYSVNFSFTKAFSPASRRGAMEHTCIDFRFQVLVAVNWAIEATSCRHGTFMLPSEYLLFWGQLFPNRQALYLIETLKSIFYKHLLGETVPFHVQYF